MRVSIDLYSRRSFPYSRSVNINCRLSCNSLFLNLFLNFKQICTCLKIGLSHISKVVFFHLICFTNCQRLVIITLQLSVRVALPLCLSVLGAHLALEMLAGASVNRCVSNLPTIFTQLLHSPMARARIFIVPDYFQERSNFQISLR